MIFYYWNLGRQTMLNDRDVVPSVSNDDCRIMSKLLKEKAYSPLAKPKKPNCCFWDYLLVF